VDLLLVRRLAPWQGNLRKRLAKSPKIDLRDSGLVHALLGIGDREALLRHPVAGGSWEGLAIGSLIAAAPSGTEVHFFQTATGAEIDLLLTLPGRPERRLAVYGGRRALSARRGHGSGRAHRPVRGALRCKSCQVADLKREMGPVPCGRAEKIVAPPAA
jgi:hypothetical protein